MAMRQAVAQKAKEQWDNFLACKENLVTSILQEVTQPTTYGTVTTTDQFGCHTAVIERMYRANQRTTQHSALMCQMAARPRRRQDSPKRSARLLMARETAAAGQQGQHPRQVAVQRG